MKHQITNDYKITLAKLKHYQEAVECFDKTLKIDPKASKAWYNKGAVLIDLGYLPLALKSLKKAKELGLPQAEQAITYCQQLLQQKENS